jgi:hypothetical protein
VSSPTRRIPISNSENDGQLPDDLLAPEGEESDAEDDDTPGIEGEGTSA